MIPPTPVLVAAPSGGQDGGMSDPTGAGGPAAGLGGAEREAAIAALQVHRAAGRLDAAQYEERSVLAGRAATWPELDALFSDLPDPHAAPRGAAQEPVAGSWQEPGSGGARPFPPATGSPSTAGADPAARTPGAPAQRPPGEVLRRLTPIIALVLFFLTARLGVGLAWLWFLLIPVVGILVPGPGGKQDRHDRRGRR